MIEESRCTPGEKSRSRDENQTIQTTQASSPESNQGGTKPRKAGK